MAKNFSKAAEGIKPVYQQLEEASAEAEAEAVKAAEEDQEIKDFLGDVEAKFEELDESLDTQGRRGRKLMRINFAFSDANYDYVRVMAALNGENMTSFLNKIIDKERKANRKRYILAKNIMMMED